MRTFSKYALLGNVRAIFMVAFFTIVWASCIAWGFGWNFFTIAFITFFFVYSVWLCIEATKENRIIRALPDSPLTEYDKRIRKRFVLNFVIEIVLIMVCNTILVNHVIGNSNYIVPMMGVIVGAHFIYLGFLFRMRIHIILGIIMIVIAVVPIILIICGKWINQSIGACALATAICVAVMNTYILRFVKAELKKL